MLHFVKKEWTTKPPLGTPLRTDGHWSVQRLVGAWVFNEGAGGIACDSGFVGNLSLTNADIIRIPDGVQHVGTSISGTTLTLLKPLNLGNQLTYVLSCRLTSAGGYAHLIGDGSNGSMQCGLKYFGGAFYIIAGDISSGGSLPNPVNAGRGVLALTINGTDARYYRKGMLVASRTAAINTGTTRAWQISSDGNNRDVYGEYHFALVYSRPLSASEVAAISGNPYQIFQPLLVPVFVGAGGSPIYLTHDLRAAIATAQTGVADSRVAVSGSLLLLADCLAAVSSAVSATHDTRATIASQIATGHDARLAVATALSTLCDTLLTVSAQVGYAVNHDTRMTISTAWALAQDLRGTVSSSVSIAHDTRQAVATAVTAMADTLADISVQIGYAVQQDTRVIVSRQFAAAADTLAAIAAEIRTTQDTRLIIGLINRAAGVVFRLAAERRIHVMPPERRVFILPREGRS